ncbi:MAG: class I SAM-dependent rRNA methyltransferase [Alphaproteobacteria bacterium]|nr:class I SAM-dependent rRNA methyltransferase [Alphaproteobacteria bacterium]MCB9931656.1 class I SAM-dependent rRNA methyltransferase [Alphaproteobacteria bacterium]
MSDLPRITVLPGKHKRAKLGHPWIYANEVAMTAEVKALPPGSLVTVANSGGEVMGTAFFSANTLAVARMLDRRPDRPFDAAFVAERVQRAAAWRAKLFPEPFHRLIHAEADGLPGLIVDRFGPGLVCQLNTAGMDRHRDAVIDGLRQAVQPDWLLLRNDSAQRSLEKLPETVETAFGQPPSPLEILENGVVYLSDVAGGQKTGWFYDQRLNRAMVAALAPGASVLDAYCYLGGFGLLAAKAGAAAVTLLDRSEPALALAAEAAARNGLAERVSTQRGEVFDALDAYAAEKRRFDVVVIDPPAFAKSRKDLQPALRGYRKLARQAARLVAPGGFLLANSCSHTVDVANFTAETTRGVFEAGRTARVLRTTGASPDHPTHPQLPESAYLKALLLNLD